MGRMITVSLEDALRAGTFGPLAPGMTRAQVASLVGPPDAMGSTSRKYRTPRIWKYGDIEVRYELGADRLTTVALREFGVPTGGATIHLDPWVIRGHMARQEAEDALDRRPRGPTLPVCRRGRRIECCPCIRGHPYVRRGAGGVWRAHGLVWRRLPRARASIVR